MSETKKDGEYMNLSSQFKKLDKRPQNRYHISRKNVKYKMKFINLPWSIIPKVYLLRNRKDIIKIINESVYNDFQNDENFFF